MSISITRLIWDFDGTLYDTYPLMTEALLRALADFGQTADPAEALLLMKNTLYTAECVYAERFGLSVEALKEAFRRRHSEQTGFPMMPGLADCLRKTADAGCRHYLFTHRDHRAVEQLKADGLADCFKDFVVREDGFADKPSPEAILHLMTKHGFAARNAVMIGDRALDMDSGRAAGTKRILFDPDGYYADASADARVKTLGEIPGVIARLTEQQRP